MVKMSIKFHVVQFKFISHIFELIVHTFKEGVSRESLTRTDHFLFLLNPTNPYHTLQKWILKNSYLTLQKWILKIHITLSRLNESQNVDLW